MWALTLVGWMDGWIGMGKAIVPDFNQSLTGRGLINKKYSR